MSLFSNWINDNVWDCLSGGEGESATFSPGGTIQGSSECTYENEYALDDNLAEISDAWFARHPELLPPPKGK